MRLRCRLNSVEHVREGILNILKRIMYQLSGFNFSELITRKFTADIAAHESSGSLSGVFDCYSKNVRTADFDLLRFNASFQDTLYVKDFQDTTHLSMHFQLSGTSNASISCLPADVPMQKGQFNILNCVDPVSSFVFPAQAKYDYLCVGLKTSFFDEVVEDCGPAYADVLRKSKAQKGFSLFAGNAVTSRHQLDVLNCLQAPPVADNLRVNYLASKVQELLILSLGMYSSSSQNQLDVVSVSDREKLEAVRNYLSINYLLALDMKSISRQFLLNEFKLKKGFKLLFSQTVFGFIHELRMLHAATLLNEGGLSIGEIATIVGYTSDSSFIRAFGTFYGYPPGKASKRR